MFGESDAFGIGVELEETWAYGVALREAKRLGIDESELCVMNFAEGGSSNSAIARMVLTQCSCVRPDLVLINFAQHQRIEAYANGSTFPVGPWHDTEHAEQTVAHAHEAGGLKARLGDQLERARAFLRYCDHDQGLFQSTRDVLLVQSMLKAEGIEALAIARTPEHYLRPEIVEDFALGPLVELIDREFFRLDISPLHLVEDVDWSDVQHYGPRTHAAVAERAFAALRGTAAPLEPDPDVEQHKQNVALVTDSVRDFYTELPFNYHGTEKDALAAIRQPTIERTYPDLHRFLQESAVHRTESNGSLNLSVLEVGCGAGWLSHGLALHYNVDVEAIDLTPAALDRARALAPRVGTEARVRFRECNVFDFHTSQRYDLILSMGVLHHTGDAWAALKRVARYLAPGGHVYLGLYHAPGRRVFLDEMGRLAREEGEEAAFQRYRELDRVHAGDDTLARSWFRDQVLHPHETQHTLKEVCGWFDELGIELVSTSINRFGPISDRALLFDDELEYEGVSRRALFDEKRYFPGFFTAFGRRTT
ncbi:MAG: class I SAM-dependent methyltransferase [Planctomycetota bacterium]